MEPNYVALRNSVTPFMPYLPVAVQDDETDGQHRRIDHDH